jgi:hypothetical protein
MSEDDDKNAIKFFREQIALEIDKDIYNKILKDSINTMSKLKPCKDINGVQTGWSFYCPGCDKQHSVSNGWQFNGDTNKPTFSPSILVIGKKEPDVDPETGDFARGANGKYIVDYRGVLVGATDTRCHSFITDGVIKYLSDCTHDLAGEEVALLPCESWFK